MRFKNTRVYNFDRALHGMRNPKESWNLGDTEHGFFIDTPPKHLSKYYVIDDYYLEDWSLDKNGRDCKKRVKEYISIGPNDLRLAKTLIKAGSVHRKFMRQIFVTVDITAPLYWWKEYATYKVGTTENSTSTMHKLASTPITFNCFEHDDYLSCEENNEYWDYTIKKCESLRVKYNETKNKKYWKELIRRLPDSWLQTRTCTLSYENLLNICQKDCRRNHKLNEWSGIDIDESINFISWVRSLPYAEELIFLDEIDETVRVSFERSELQKILNCLQNNYDTANKGIIEKIKKILLV